MRTSLLFLALIAGMISACTEGTSSKSAAASMPLASGPGGSMTVVIENNLWASEVGDSIKAWFAAPQYGLPQIEPLFDLVNTPKGSFKSVLRLQPNVLVVEIDPKLPASGEVVNDLWARKQVISKITAPNKDAFMRILHENGQRMIDAHNNAERERIESNFRTVPEQPVIDEVKTQYDLELALPKEFTLAVSRSNFAWLRLEKQRPKGSTYHPIDEGILIWYTPYTDTAQFSLDSLMAVRDSITKKYILGGPDGSYMAISHRMMEPEVRQIPFQDRYTVEMRGLWRMENGFMGGPFVSITTLDTKNSRLVTIDGYVFAPQFEKREYLREVEAIVKSAKFIAE